MSIVANTSKVFYQHAWETYFIGGLIIFLIGLLVGWFLWRHCLARAEQIEALNEKLRERQDVLSNKSRKLSKLMKELPKDPTS